MDNKAAVREQHCGVGNSRSGDVLPPDFCRANLPTLTFPSLQPQFLLKAAMQAGATGEAGEMEKDERHELDVLSMGGLFFPLIVETLGLWTPSSLKVLRLIASEAASLNGIPRGQVVSNLLQQLSIHLRTFNATFQTRVEGVRCGGLGPTIYWLTFCFVCCVCVVHFVYMHISLLFYLYCIYDCFALRVPLFFLF